MLLWNTNLKTLNPFLSLPRVLNLASETQYEPKYRHDGKYRQGQDYCVFKYTLAGEGAFLDGAGEHRVPAGSGFLVTITDPATAYYYPPDAREPWTFVYIAFAGEAAVRIVNEMVRRYGPIYSPDADSPAIRQMRAFEAHYGEPMELTATQGAGLVMNLLLELSDDKERHRTDDPGMALVRLAQDVVGRYLERRINVSELAKKLRVSREHLTRVFAQTLHQTPHAYIIRQKMLWACRLLKETALTGKQIAAKLGYLNDAHFARSFKQELYMTPANFRRRGVIPLM